MSGDNGSNGARTSEQPVLGLFIEVGKGPFFMDVRYIDLEHIEETYIASLL